MPLYFVIGIPVTLWILLRFTLPAGPYEMDHGHGSAKGTFFPLLILYQAFFYILAGLALFGAHWNWQYNDNLWPSLFLCVAALYALLFNGFVLFFYEGYLTTKYPGPTRPGVSSYTISRYALVLSLGFSSVGLFVAGAAWVALLAAGVGK
jgi:hypothetical protein